MITNSEFNPWSPKHWSISDEEAIDSPVRITIGILNYNRKDDLRRTLDCITLAVQFPDIEVIVVDNGSSDGSVEMVRFEFPDVRIIPLRVNKGIAARNYFYHSASGKYVFSFDDDSFPATPAMIFHTVKTLELHPDIDTLTFYCYQPLTGYTETGEAHDIYIADSSKKGFKGLSYAEGAMCIKATSWRKIQGYDADFFWGAEGVELTLQMYEQGMKALYHPGLAALHMKSGENRNQAINFYYFTRNHIWAIGKHFPFYAAFPLIILYILRKVIAICLHPQYTISYLKGIKDGILGISSQRKKIKKLKLKQIFHLNQWYLYFYRW